MDKLRKWLQGKKTHLSVIGAVATGLAMLASGEITTLEFLWLVFTGGSVSALRAGVAKDAGK